MLKMMVGFLKLKFLILLMKMPVMVLMNVIGKMILLRVKANAKLKVLQAVYGTVKEFVIGKVMIMMKTPLDSVSG